MDPHITPSVYLTAALPGIGGRLKERPEDFLVEEQPLYEPAGAGEHIYLFVEKRGMSTMRVARLLARHFGVRLKAIGYAGLKDKHAITRQVFSIHAPGRRLGDFPSLQHDRLGVLWADYHLNKLRRGHLAGNRFSIRIRGVEPARVLIAERALRMLARTGVPDRIGEQRFGYRRNNHLVGRAMLRGEHAEAINLLLAPGDEADTPAEARRAFARGDVALALELFPREFRTERVVLGALSRGATPARAIAMIPTAERSFFLTAFQSAIFNGLLDARMEEGMLGTLREGDLAFKHDNRAVFPVGPREIADPQTPARLERLEISPSGPMWGAAMPRAAGATERVEVDALHAAGVTPEDLARFDEKHGGLIQGTRRPFRVPLLYPDVEAGVDEHGPYIRCAFDLPRGAFATAVLREIMKPQQAAPAPAEPAEPED